MTTETIDASSKYIAEYIVALRNRGPFLLYNDYALIEQWVTSCPDLDKLMLVLDDILPEHFQGTQTPPKAPSLKKVAKRVAKSLSALAGEAY